MFCGVINSSALVSAVMCWCAAQKNSLVQCVCVFHSRVCARVRGAESSVSQHNVFCSLLHVLRPPTRLTWSSGKMLDPSNVFGQASRR